jgi:hypothetical protein
MTVDEITAEVGSRRVSKALEEGSPDLDDWTKVNTEGSTDGSVDLQETPVDVDVEEVEEESEEEATTFLPEDAAEDDDDAFGLGKAVTYRRGWYPETFALFELILFFLQPINGSRVRSLVQDISGKSILAGMLQVAF